MNNFHNLVYINSKNKKQELSYQTIMLGLEKYWPNSGNINCFIKVFVAKTVEILNRIPTLKLGIMINERSTSFRLFPPKNSFLRRSNFIFEA